jgi:hypothetical protein
MHLKIFIFAWCQVLTDKMPCTILLSRLWFHELPSWHSACHFSLSTSHLQLIHIHVPKYLYTIRPLFGTLSVEFICERTGNCMLSTLVTAPREGRTVWLVCFTRLTPVGWNILAKWERQSCFCITRHAGALRTGSKGSHTVTRWHCLETNGQLKSYRWHELAWLANGIGRPAPRYQLARHRE